MEKKQIKNNIAVGFEIETITNNDSIRQSFETGSYHDSDDSEGEINDFWRCENDGSLDSFGEYEYNGEIEYISNILTYHNYMKGLRSFREIFKRCAYSYFVRQSSNQKYAAIKT